eukprot:1752159-Alexandrium_andersonii.AAC.1
MPAPTQAASLSPEPWVIPQDTVRPGPLEPGPVQASVAQGLANAPWRMNVDRVANAVTEAMSRVRSWASGNEPSAEGPVLDPVARAAQEFRDDEPEPEKDQYGCPFTRVHPADIGTAL